MKRTALLAAVMTAVCRRPVGPGPDRASAPAPRPCRSTRRSSTRPAGSSPTSLEEHFEIIDNGKPRADHGVQERRPADHRRRHARHERQHDAEPRFPEGRRRAVRAAAAAERSRAHRQLLRSDLHQPDVHEQPRRPGALSCTPRSASATRRSSGTRSIAAWTRWRRSTAAGVVLIFTDGDDTAQRRDQLRRRARPRAGGGLS